jgi:hypothetical protein
MKPLPTQGWPVGASGDDLETIVTNVVGSAPMNLARVALSRRGLAYLTAVWVALLVIAQAAFNNNHTVSDIVWAIMFAVLVVLIVRAAATLVQFGLSRSH